jgi:hypothetical protein
MQQKHVRLVDRDKVSSVASLAQCNSFRGCAFWIETTTVVAEKQWRSFLVDYSGACRVRDEFERTVLCLVTHDRSIAVCEDVTLSHHPWDGHISPLDIWAYVRYRREPTRELDGFYDHLAGALVADVAGHDMDLAERLSTSPIQDLLEPVPLLLEYARFKGWTKECVSPQRWADGHFGIVDGGRRVHSAILAVAGDSKGVARRVWEAQSRVLFPLLEQLRIWILPHAARLIRPPFLTLLGHRQVVVNSVDDLELGQLEYHLAGTRLSTQVSCLAEMRRRLAHLEVVGSRELLGKQFQSALREYRTECAKSSF